MLAGNDGAVRSRLRPPYRASVYFLLGVVALTAAGVWYLWPRTQVNHIVYAAVTDVPAYHQITAANIQKKEVPSGQAPGHTTANPDDLIGRYTLVATSRGQPFDLDELGPRLTPGILAAQIVVGLQATIADVDGGTIARGDHIDVLLSSTATQNPRDGVLPGALVLDMKPGQPGQVVLVCAFPEKYENVLLAAGGTARIFVALIPRVSSH